MGREVRMVPPDWQHPTEFGKDWRTGQPKLRHRVLLKGSFAQEVADWDAAAAKWAEGLRRDYSAYPGVAWMPKAVHNTGAYAEYAGERPVPENYMPEFAPGTATHLMAGAEWMPKVTHALERTSPTGPGHKFIGRCRRCGMVGLLMSAALEECQNYRGLSDDETLLEAIRGEEGR